MITFDCLTRTQYETMRVILSRVLSEEIAHQEIWEKQDIERFGECTSNRKNIIEEIKTFMERNNIEFREDFYFNQF